MSTSTQHTDKPQTRVVEQFFSIVCLQDGRVVKAESHDTYELANARLMRLMQTVQKAYDRDRNYQGIYGGPSRLYGKVERRLVIEDA